MLETMTGIPKMKLHFKYSSYYLIQHIYRSTSISVLHYSTTMTYNTELPSRYLRKKKTTKHPLSDNLGFLYF